MIDVKASIEAGSRLRSYNAWNKEMPIVVKGVGNNSNAFQLPPMVRAIIPTNQTLEPGKIYIDHNAALQKGLALVTGVQIVAETSQVELYIKNVSESLVTISNGDVLAQLVGDDE